MVCGIFASRAKSFTPIPTKFRQQSRSLPLVSVVAPANGLKARRPATSCSSIFTVAATLPVQRRRTGPLPFSLRSTASTFLLRTIVWPPKIAFPPPLKTPSLFTVPSWPPDIHHETSSSPVSLLAAVFHSRSCSRCATLAFRFPLPLRFFLHGPILPPPASPFEPTPTAAPCFMVRALPTRLATISVTPTPAIRSRLPSTPISLVFRHYSST